jgi:hypothetical protein
MITHTMYHMILDMLIIKFLAFETKDTSCAMKKMKSITLIKTRAMMMLMIHVLADLIISSLSNALIICMPYQIVMMMAKKNANALRNESTWKSTLFTKLSRSCVVHCTTSICKALPSIRVTPYTKNAPNNR